MLITPLLYILQIEGYDIKKFLTFVYTHPKWWQLQKRGELKWTMKAKAIAALAVIVAAAAVIAAFINSIAIGSLILFFIIPLLPLLLAASTISLTPMDWYLKERLIARARNVFQDIHKDLTVIGITGSYGKTSTKEILSTILREQFTVTMIGENINTDMGVAEFIINNRDTLRQSDIFVVEMGAYKRGEIKRICDIVEPDHAIITGVNESHLERFGSIENTLKAKFELAQAAKGTVVVNLDDSNIKANYTSMGIKDCKGVSKDAVAITTADNFGGLQFVVDGQPFRTKLLAKHNVSLVMLAVEIARELGMTLEAIARGVEKVQHVPHRLQPIHNELTDIWVIDDSYNGNIDGIRSGLEVLGRAKGRKVVLTPGLVELGDKEQEIHARMADLYISHDIDLLLLVKNRATGYIIDELRKQGYTRYTIYDTTQEAHADLGSVLKSGDTILFQNDWTDNYF